MAHDLGAAPCKYGPGTYGEQVRLGLPGAVAGDTSAGFDGATPDGIWGSSVTLWCPRYNLRGREPNTVEAWINPARLDGAARRIYSHESEWFGAILGRLVRPGPHAGPDRRALRGRVSLN